MAILAVRFCVSGRRIAGALLLGVGLVGDCWEGLLFISPAGGCNFLWHLFFALLWLWGGHLLAWQAETHRAVSSAGLWRWGLTAPVLGVGTFPGLGPLACTLTFVLARSLCASALVEGAADRESQHAVRQAEKLCLHDGPVLPFVDGVIAGNTEARRAVVAELGRAANPGATHLLRRLLSDPEAEIRCDASIALKHLEDTMSHDLHQAFADWRTNPADAACSLAFIKHCYGYATSNVLDAQCQRLYLVLVRDLAQQVLADGRQTGSDLWLTLADVRQRLGEFPQALQDALHVLHTWPEIPAASLLAMDLAFCCHEWDLLRSLAGQSTDILPADSLLRQGHSALSLLSPVGGERDD
ncbi:MAG TPA: hypothetical protein VGF67_33995 [Ktedonobacteraceae bacterium]